MYSCTLIACWFASGYCGRIQHCTVYVRTHAFVDSLMWFLQCLRVGVSHFFLCVPLCLFHPVGYTTDDLQFMWQTGDPVQMDAIALPQFDIRQEDIDYGNCTKFYAGTGTVLIMNPFLFFLTVFRNSNT